MEKLLRGLSCSSSKRREKEQQQQRQKEQQQLRVHQQHQQQQQAGHKPSGGAALDGDRVKQPVSHHIVVGPPPAAAAAAAAAQPLLPPSEHPPLNGQGSRSNNHSSAALIDMNGKQKREEWVEQAHEEGLTRWDFDVFSFAERTQGNPLITMTVALLELHNLMDGWKVNRQTVENFLLLVEAGYSTNSYHNAIHATDVTQTAAIILQDFSKQVPDVPKMDVFCIIMASAVHDLGHLGVNNDFLINSRHPRATTYNDKSVNENYHISKAFELARTNSGCDIFELFTFEEQKKCRQLMIDVVLATDMAIHFELLKNFNSHMEATPDVSLWQDRSLLYRMIVHLADIANPSRPFVLARGWAERVIQEFCEQGDKEEQAGLAVSPFCNRATMNMPRAQINFIEIFVKPTLQSFQNAAPGFIKMSLACLDQTIAEWKKLEAAGVKMPAGL